MESDFSHKYFTHSQTDITFNLVEGIVETLSFYNIRTLVLLIKRRKFKQIDGRKTQERKKNVESIEYIIRNGIY